jgi:hypothetical protein
MLQNDIAVGLADPNGRGASAAAANNITDAQRVESAYGYRFKPISMPP